eukprot:TRINITY_DN60232_c0_g1_i1.p1 TRINITY_DN60232_c0_g1~~TRINITY_DN60232_c0_g1_i1.p1  ORF type:complete len:252 (+),score=65.36 TRINITY_DN60232_c0_g1_i1:90-845(+)
MLSPATQGFPGGLAEEAAAAVELCGAGPARRELLATCRALSRRRIGGDLMCLLLQMRYPSRRPFDFLRSAAQHRLMRLDREISAAVTRCRGLCYAAQQRYLDGCVPRATAPGVGDYVRLRRSTSSGGPGVLGMERGVLDDGCVGCIEATTDVNVRICGCDAGGWYAKGAVYKIVDEDTFEWSLGGAVRLYPRPMEITFDGSLFAVGPTGGDVAARLKRELGARFASEGFSGEVTVIADNNVMRVYIWIAVL